MVTAAPGSTKSCPIHLSSLTMCDPPLTWDSVRSPESRAREVAERLTAATGSEARTTETPSAIRVEVDVPDEVTTELLTVIVAALGAADRYGHDHTATSGVAWAEITRLP